LSASLGPGCASNEIRTVSSGLVVSYERDAYLDHRINTRATRLVEKLNAAKAGNKDSASPREVVYGEATVRGWDPLLETSTDVPAHLRPVDFESPERQIFGPDL
jgi:hypothetical protein